MANGSPSNENSVENKIETIRWINGPNGDATGGHLRLVDQVRLPEKLVYLDLYTVDEVWDAIKRLSVRGAPAIGIAAAYGACLSMDPESDSTLELKIQKARKASEYLATSRPTAVNLFWALDRINARLTEIESQGRSEGFTGSASAFIQSELLKVAKSIHEEDRQMCHSIGQFGAELLKDGDHVLTHCNAGGLATAEYGTALSVFFTAQDQGKNLHVYVDETRPLLQGARLTAWECMQRDLPCTLICDSMAAHVMHTKKVDAIVTGADRIAANGDSANKIGTYGLAVLAKHHGIPFYIAAPSSTFDLSIPDGSHIPIEERKEDEITEGFGKRTAPVSVPVYNPAFDVAPADLITGIITEKGLIQPVDRQTVESVLDC